MTVAYHGDAHLKTLFVKVLKWHYDQDRIVQGTYWDDKERPEAECQINGVRFTSNGVGCAVGCSIESLGHILGRTDLSHKDHAAYEELIGVPRVLARLEDSIFERLPVDEAREWPISFAEAIPVGADLSLVWPRFAIWLLGDKQDGVIRFAKTDRPRAAIQTVIDLYGCVLEGQPPEIAEWKDAAAAAAAAAYADAYAYAAAAAAAAAYADADAYAYAAADAYARTLARQRQATKLLELLAAA